MDNTCDECYMDSICRKWAKGQAACIHFEPKPSGRRCGTCKWLGDVFTSVCVCDKSDHLADYVGIYDSCPEWEGMDELHRTD